jgi:CRAL/TRIO domain
MNLYTTYDAVRLLCYVITVLVEEEETQISGIICLFDHANANLKHLMTPTDVRDFMHFVKNCSACRQKGTYVMNLPSFANFILEIFKSTLSAKLRKRFFLLKNKDDLKNHIDIELLPKSYGGKRTEEDMMEDFKKLRDDKRQNLLKFLEVKIDWSKVSPEKIFSKEEDETVGSFRKLEID